MWDGTKLILRGLWMVRYMHVVIPRAVTKKVMQKDISIQPTGKLKWNTKIYSNDQNLKRVEKGKLWKVAIELNHKDIIRKLDTVTSVR